MPCSAVSSLVRFAVIFAFFHGVCAWSQSNEFRALWVDAWNGDVSTQTSCTSLLNNSRAGNLNALVVQVRRRGDAFYNSNFEPKNPAVSPKSFDPLGYLIQQGHDTSGGKKKVEIHAWLVTYHVWQGSTFPSDPTHPLNLHPDWLLKNFNGETNIGNEYTFDPGHPDVQRHTFNVAMDIVTNYNVDGINFDYVRYSGTDEGYNDVSVARFNRLYGRTGKPSPTDAAWKQFRRDQVTALVRKIYLSAIAVRPEVKISADTITWAPGPISDATWYSSSAAWNSVLQDWRGWMEEGILDINIPMNYFRQTTHLNDFINWSTFAKDRRFNRHLVNGPGIYLNSVSDAIWQLRHSRTPTALGNTADGSCGYVYKTTNKDGVPTTTFLNALVNKTAYDTNTTPMYATWVPVPEMPWKTSPTRGHLKGFVSLGTVTNYADGATISITGPVTREMVSDGTGFYGAVDLLPGSYRATVSFPGYFAKSANFTVTAGVVTNLDFLLNPATWTITQQPQNKTVNEGANATFSVAANAPGPLTYEWRFNDALIPGATQSSYTRTNVQPEHAGLYSVIVSDGSNSLVSSNANLIVNFAPKITAQPQSISTNQAVDVTFNVAATGTAPLSYQWRRNGTPISGATQSSYTRFNVQTNDSGDYSVVVSNSIGATTSSNAVLNVIFQLVPPTISAQPQNRFVTAGESVTFIVGANGTAPLSYQWKFNGQNIPGAQGASLTLSSVSASAAGNYSVGITNDAGGILSESATLTVQPPFRANGVELLWKLAPGSRPYLGTGSTERGLAFNPVTGNLLVTSRASGAKIFVLDGDTGNELRSMNVNTSIVQGGQYALNLISVADDGVVYGCNLILSPPGLKVYRWNDDSATSAPVLVFNGDPAPGTGDRWGDTFDVRGSGTNTQILLGSRNGTTAAILTTTNGTNFTSTPISVSGVSVGSFGLGIAFGRENTFWGKSTGGSLRQIQFDLATGIGTVINTISTGDFASNIGGIGVSAARNLIAGIATETPGRLRLYEITGNPVTTAHVASETFPSANANSNFTGAADFGDDRVFGLYSNNGLVALRILPLLASEIQAISLLPGKRFGLQVEPSTNNHVVIGSSDLLNWTEITNASPTNGYFEFNDSTNASQRFFRLKIP